MTLYEDVSEIDFEIQSLPRVPRPDRVLMANPLHYDVAYAINPHMRDAMGALRKVDRVRATHQWERLKNEFERLGLVVDVLEPLEGHPDLVFCANQALHIPSMDGDGSPAIVPSNMFHAERRGEVPHVVSRLAAMGYRVEPLSTTASFEGTGDGIWHPGRALLWAGYGHRSKREAWREIASKLRVPTILLGLVDEAFYHLDTCFALLDERTCLWLPDAFDERARALVRALIPRPIAADAGEARTLLACNACCPDGRHVLMQRGCTRTAREVSQAGFDVLELDTDEFLKAGGSVFCLKLLHGPLPGA